MQVFYVTSLCINCKIIDCLRELLFVYELIQDIKCQRIEVSRYILVFILSNLQSLSALLSFFLENHQIVLKEKSPKCYAHQIKIISQYMYECRLHMADLVFKAKLRRPV